MKHMVPTLKFSASFSLALQLWGEQDIEERISRFDFKRNELNYIFGKTSWPDVIDDVVAKVHEYRLPESLKNMVLRSVNVVAWQVYGYAVNCLKCRNFSLEEVHWTAQGCVNKKRSLEEFVRNESYCYNCRLQIASTYCLEQFFPGLWDRADLWDRDGLDVSMCEPCEESSYYDTKMYDYWWFRRSVKGSLQVESVKEELKSKAIKLFDNSVSQINETACKYFWPVLREIIEPCDLLIWATHILKVRELKYFEFPDYQMFSGEEFYPELFFFLYSLMDEKTKIKMLLINPRMVLDCFLDWPGQQYFIQISHQLWTIISNNKQLQRESAYACFKVTKKIVKREMIGYNDYDYSFLVTEFIRYMPSECRMYILHNSNDGGVDCLLYKLFLMRDITILSFLLTDATAKLKQRTLFSDLGASVCRVLASKSQWAQLSSFIKMCMDPGAGFEEKITFKNKFKSLMSEHRLKDDFGENTSCRVLEILEQLTS